MASRLIRFRYQKNSIFSSPIAATPAADPITDPIANASIIEMELVLEEDTVRGRILGWARGDHLAEVV